MKWMAEYKLRRAVRKIKVPEHGDFARSLQEQLRTQYVYADVPTPRKSVSWIFLALVPVGVAACAVWYVTMRDLNTSNAHLALNNTNQQIAVNENTNRVSNENVNEASMNTNTAIPEHEGSADVIIAAHISLQSALLGAGGGGMPVTSEWTITNTLAPIAATTIQAPSQPHLSDDVMRSLLKRLGVEKAQRVAPEVFRSSDITLFSSNSLRISECALTMYESGHPKQCAVMSSIGSFVFVPGTGAGETNGWEQFYKTANALFEEEPQNWSILESVPSDSDATITEYTVQPKVVIDGVAVLVPVWHVVMRGDTLLGFIGVLPVFSAAESTSIISSTEAFVRLTRLLDDTLGLQYFAVLADIEHVPSYRAHLTVNAIELNLSYGRSFSASEASVTPAYRFLVTDENGVSTQIIVSALPDRNVPTELNVVVDSLYFITL